MCASLKTCKFITILISFDIELKSKTLVFCLLNLKTSSRSSFLAVKDHFRPSINIPNYRKKQKILEIRMNYRVVTNRLNAIRPTCVPRYMWNMCGPSINLFKFASITSAVSVQTLPSAFCGHSGTTDGVSGD